MQIIMNIQNVITALNLFMRKQLRVLKLEPNTNGTKNVKSQINFFLISKKKRFVKALERKLEVNGKEICDQAKITDKIKIFFAAAFKCHKGKSLTNLFNILNSIDLPCLTNKQKVKLNSD